MARQQKYDTEFLRHLFGEVLRKRYPDLKDFELDAFLSGFVTTFELTAVNRLIDSLGSGQNDSFGRFESVEGLDFKQLSRDDLLLSLEASSGLDGEACDQALQALEASLFASVKGTTNRVELAPLGTVRKRGSTGLELVLSDEALGVPVRSLAVAG